VTILRATGSFPTHTAGCQLLIKYVRQRPDRVRALRARTGSGGRWPSDCWPSGSGCAAGVSAAIADAAFHAIRIRVRDLPTRIHHPI
jgi:hypothetical protein